MYQPMLFLHWKQIRFGLIPLIVAAFALPLLTVQGLGIVRGMDTATLEAYRIVAESQVWLIFFPLLAFAVGMTLALSSWNWDHQLRHVYALSLPVTRLEYTMLKMGAGVALAILPALGLWLGAHAASATIALPEGLHAYPNQLAMRFFLASMVSYALLFAMASGTMKTTLWVISSVLVFLVVGTTATELLANYFPYFVQHNLVEIVFMWLVDAPGPFEIFAGNWNLIDV